MTVLVLAVLVVVLAASAAAISPGGPVAGNEAVVERADDEPEIVKLQMRKSTRTR